MAEKKANESKAAAPKATEEKKTTTRRPAAKKVALDINAETVGFKAGDVYQALHAAGEPLTVAQIAKAAQISEPEALLGMGWLFKEGKVKGTEGKVTLA